MEGSKTRDVICRQYLLFILNFLVWLTGSTLMAVGIWAKVTKGGFDDLSTLDTDPTTYIIISGCILFFVSGFGCVGALRQNLCLLYAHCASLAVLIILQFVGGILVLLLQETVVDSALRFFEKAVVRYRDDPDLQDAVDYIQAEFRCCGAASYADWQMNVYFNCSSPGREACGVPFSCCIDMAMNYQCGLDVRTKTKYEIFSTIYIHGCIDSFVLWMMDNILLLGLLVFASLFLQKLN
ncbi:tetraspanin-33-like isoform X2 [Acanthaster planci]|uniref:Tetraspanin n=1 Tax=Acanthaster planci TaxID=133434 RepID=A0A8B7XNT3_ACAPL|nr:tetraspanin-33-like isoform X2 [Acanthaster planci]